MSADAAAILKQQGESLIRMSGRIGPSFEKALKWISECEGTALVIGFGKSGAVGQKITATLRSAGRKAVLLSPLDALHGEMAAAHPGDIALAVSSTGESDEIMHVLPYLRKKKIKLIALTPSPRSSLARAADVLLQTAMPHDAADSCASYSSCLSAMAIGDLLGLCLLRGQDIEHGPDTDRSPREAIYTVADLINTRPQNPTAPEDMMIRDALIEITAKGLGAISIVNADGALTGIITDGDIRRLLQRSMGSLTRLFLTNVDAAMTRNPMNVSPDHTVFDALRIMENHAITVLPVVDENGRPAGMVHLHDLVQMGLLHRKPVSAGRETKPVKKTAAKKKPKAKKPGGARAKK